MGDVGSYNLPLCVNTFWNKSVVEKVSHESDQQLLFSNVGLGSDMSYFVAYMVLIFMTYLSTIKEFWVDLGFYSCNIVELTAQFERRIKIDPVELDKLSFLFSMFFFLVKICCLHYSQCNMT